MKNINLFVPKFRNDEIFELKSECLDKGWTGLGFKTNELGCYKVIFSCFNERINFYTKNGFFKESNTMRFNL